MRSERRRLDVTLIVGAGASLAFMLWLAFEPAFATWKTRWFYIFWFGWLVVLCVLAMLLSRRKKGPK